MSRLFAQYLGIWYVLLHHTGLSLLRLSVPSAFHPIHDIWGKAADDDAPGQLQHSCRTPLDAEQYRRCALGAAIGPLHTR